MTWLHLANDTEHDMLVAFSTQHQRVEPVRQRLGAKYLDLSRLEFSWVNVFPNDETWEWHEHEAVYCKAFLVKRDPVAKGYKVMKQICRAVEAGNGRTIRSLPGMMGIRTGYKPREALPSPPGQVMHLDIEEITVEDEELSPEEEDDEDIFSIAGSSHQQLVMIEKELPGDENMEIDVEDATDGGQQHKADAQETANGDFSTGHMDNGREVNDEVLDHGRSTGTDTEQINRVSEQAVPLNNPDTAYTTPGEFKAPREVNVQAKGPGSEMAKQFGERLAELVAAIASPRACTDLAVGMDEMNGKHCDAANMGARTETQTQVDDCDAHYSTQDVLNANSRTEHSAHGHDYIAPSSVPDENKNM